MHNALSCFSMSEIIDLTVSDTDAGIAQSVNKENQPLRTTRRSNVNAEPMSSSIAVPHLSKRHKSSSGVTSLTNKLDSTLLPTLTDTLNDINVLTECSSVHTVSTRNTKRTTPSTHPPATVAQCRFQYQWAVHGTTLHILHPAGVQCSNSKILALDMDSTLIRTKSGRKFPINADDWQWFSPNVCSKLHAAHSNGYRIVIVSNQAALSHSYMGAVKQAELYKKVLNIMQSPELQHIPITVFLAGGNDLYRKPNTKAWLHFIAHYNSGVPAGSDSMFIGDAAGRAAGYDGNSATKADFSASDRKFALNCSLAFATPEEYFDGQPAAPYTLDIEPDVAQLMQQVNDDNKLRTGATVFTSVTTSSTSTVATRTECAAPATTKYHALHSKTQELIVFVGCMASGKSSFAKQYLLPHNYIHINQDTLKTRDKCVQQAEVELQAGHSVVVDNTNPTPAVRKLYVQLAQKYNVPARCCYFSTSITVAQHLNKMRAKLNNKSKYIPAVAFNVYRSKLVMPTLSEKFSEIITVDLEPRFDTDEQRKMFNELT